MNDDRILEDVGKLLRDGNVVQRRRKMLGMTQKQLSTVTGIGLSTIRSYERDELRLEKASGEALFKLSRALGVTIEEILLG